MVFVKKKPPYIILKAPWLNRFFFQSISFTKSLITIFLSVADGVNYYESFDTAASGASGQVHRIEAVGNHERFVYSVFTPI